MSCRPHVLQRLRTRLNRNLTRSNLGQIEFPARVVDVNSDQIAVAVVVEYDALGNLAAFDAWPRREINVQRIRVGIVIQLHGLKFRSGNALRIERLSASVITRRYRPPSSGTEAQNPKPLFSC